MANDALKNGPPSVRIIRKAADWSRRNTGPAVLITVAAVLMFWLLGGIYAVRVEESAVLLRFGRMIDDSVGSGLHLRLPWGIDAVTKVKTGEVRRLEIADESAKEISLLTGDENLIDAMTVVQYKVTRPGDYLYRTEAPEKIMKQCIGAALVDTVATMHVDDLLTTGKAEVQNRVRKAAQEMLDSYGAGIALLAVNLQSVKPPTEAAASFLKVNDAKAEAARAINAAQSARERSVNLAQGEAGKQEQEAGAAASSRIQQAAGAAERFNAVLAQKKETPELTMIDIYMDAVPKILSRAKVLILAPGQKPRVEVNLMEKQKANEPRVEQPAASPTPFSDAGKSAGQSTE